LALATDRNGKIAVTAVEAKEYPIYAVMFHPEKVPYEWTTDQDIPHDLLSVKHNLYFAHFLAEEAR
jgi:gamma-glutamyl hydrolase